MKQAKTTKQPLEDKKHVPRWLQNELSAISTPIVDKHIEFLKAGKLDNNRFCLQSLGEQLVCHGYFHANPSPPEEKPTPDSKEGLHTHGYKLEWDNDTGANDDYYREWYNLLNPDGDKIAEIKDQKDANMILKTLNERKALLDSHRELLRLVNECYGYFSAPNFTDRYGTAERLKNAINNAKNI